MFDLPCELARFACVAKFKYTSSCSATLNECKKLNYKGIRWKETNAQQVNKSVHWHCMCEEEEDDDDDDDGSGSG